MTFPPGSYDLADPADPTRDPAGKPVPRIAEVLFLVRLLAAYGRHIAGLYPHGGLWRGFASVARFLGGEGVSGTIARIHRGILRAIALERVLLKRAQRGRDLKPLARKSMFTILSLREGEEWPPGAEAKAQAWFAEALAEQQATEAWAADPYAADPQAKDPHSAEAWAAAQSDETLADEAPADEEWTDQARDKPRRPDDRNPAWLDALPSLADLEEEVRRRPIGRTLALICLDLGISPKLCAGWFWNRLFEAMEDYKGNPAGMLMDLHRREERFEKEDWKHPRRLPLPERTHEGVRRVLGFLIGEPPADPFLPALPCPAVLPCPTALPAPVALLPASFGTGPP